MINIFPDPSCSLLEGKDVLGSYDSNPIPGRTSSEEGIQGAFMQMVLSLDPMISGPNYMPLHSTGAIGAGMLRTEAGIGVVVCKSRQF